MTCFSFKRIALNFIPALFLLAVSGGLTSAQQAPAAAPAGEQRLKIATRIIPPFVMKDGAGYSGFSIDLWNAVAREISAKSDFVEKPTLAEMLGEVQAGRAEVAIAAISITAEREKAFDFSQPMFDAGLQILTTTERVSGGGLSGLITILKSPALLEILAILLVLIILPVPVIWLIERRHENGVATGKTTVGSLFNSIWWSAATIGAQAPLMPVRPLGKVIAVIWMFVSVVFISFFTATVTSALTVKQLEQSISGPQDLVGKRVATTAGSTSAAYLRQQKIEATEVDHIDDAFASLLDGRVQAVVSDAPVLLYFAANAGKGKVQTAGPVFRSENYGILFPNASPLRKQVNEALLHIRESGEFRTLYRKWFVADAPAKD